MSAYQPPDATAPPEPRKGEPLALRTRRVEGAPVFALRVWLRGGCLVEDCPGLASITGRMLVEGTTRRDWSTIVREAEARGMILSGQGTLEAHGISLDAVASDWELALDWAAELILDSQFPEDRCDWQRQLSLAELDSLRDQPDVKTAWSFLRQLYHPHPAGRPALGDKEGLLELRSVQCREFHRRALGRGCVVSVAGLIDEDRVQSRLQGLLSGLKLEGEAPSRSAPARGLEERRCAVVTNSSPGSTPQAQLYVGHLTVPRSHPDYRALELLGVILGSGSGLSGRIPTRVRERHGLAYTAQADTVAGAGLAAGRLVAYLATAPDQVEAAEAAVVEEIERLIEEGISDEELRDARAYRLGREPFRRETARQWADLLSEALFYDLPIDRLESVQEELEALTREELERVSRRHLSVSDLKTTVGMPASTAPSREG